MQMRWRRQVRQSARGWSVRAHHFVDGLMQVDRHLPSSPPPSQWATDLSTTRPPPSLRLSPGHIPLSTPSHKVQCLCNRPKPVALSYRGTSHSSTLQTSRSELSLKHQVVSNDFKSLSVGCGLELISSPKLVKSSDGLAPTKHVPDLTMLRYWQVDLSSN